MQFTGWVAGLTLESDLEFSLVNVVIFKGRRQVGVASEKNLGMK